MNDEFQKMLKRSHSLL